MATENEWDLEKTVLLLLTVLIGKGIITPGQADYIQTGIPTLREAW